MDASPPAKQHHQFKLVVLGEVAVGKSSLVFRFVRGRFLDSHEPTIGASFLAKTVDVDGVPVKLELWDTAGQERYQSLAPMYFRGAAAAMIVFDITERGSFDRARSWVDRLREQAQTNIVIALVGNKCDLEESRAVSTQEAYEYADSNGLLFMETSAKTAENVFEVFDMIASMLPGLAGGGRPQSLRLNDMNLSARDQQRRPCC